MQNESGIPRILGLLVALLTFSTCGFTSDTPLPQPTATLALSAMDSSAQHESTWATVAFSSETSIAVGLCQHECARKECSLYLVQWKDGALQLLAKTSRFNSGVSVHPAMDGKILAGQVWLPSIVYSADLSTAHDLSNPSHVSPSGKTVAQFVPDSWTLYRLRDTLEPLRVGAGELRSISDNVVVVQDGKAMKVETIVAIAAGNMLSIYRLPALCGAPTIAPGK